LLHASGISRLVPFPFFYRAAAAEIACLRHLKVCPSLLSFRAVGAKMKFSSIPNFSNSSFLPRGGRQYCMPPAFESLPIVAFLPRGGHQNCIAQQLNIWHSQ
jgi:hypothetical protein